MNIHAATIAEETAGELDDEKRRLVTACRILLMEGVSEMAFNVSVRISGDRMLTIPVTSPSLVTPDNLIIVPIEPGVSNWKAHPAIYLARPDVNAIVHVHPPYAIAFGTLGQEFRPIHHYGAPFYGKVAVDDQPGQTESSTRAAELARTLGDNCLLLQQAHGVIAVGKDIKEALLLTLFFEEACKIFAIARQMGGGANELTQAQCEKIAGQILKPRSQDKAWDHFVDKLTWRQRA